MFSSILQIEVHELIWSVGNAILDMEEARKDKAADEHSVIDDAFQDRGEDYTIFSIARRYVLLLDSQALSAHLT